MDAHLFDGWVRLLGRGVSRREFLRALLGACAAQHFLADGVRVEAQGREIRLGDPCTESFTCRKEGGRPVCARTASGILVCCHNQGGACGGDSHCCGDLRCQNGICGGGGLPVGATCRNHGECAPILPDDGWATCAAVASAAELRCCLVWGSYCSFDWECCGETRCYTPGICGGAAAGGLSIGSYCPGSTTLPCSARLADACDDNGVFEDGPTNCCNYEGGWCSEDAHCCGVTRCIEQVCSGEAPGDAPPGPDQNVASVAVWLSRQGAAGNFHALYDWVHPDLACGGSPICGHRRLVRARVRPARSCGHRGHRGQP